MSQTNEKQRERARVNHYKCYIGDDVCAAHIHTKCNQVIFITPSLFLVCFINFYSNGQEFLYVRLKKRVKLRVHARGIATLCAQKEIQFI